MDKSEILLMAEKRTALTDTYKEKTEELIEIKKKRALNWATFRSVVTSDRQAERDWEATPLGQKEIELTYILKAIEKQLSAMKLEIEVLRDESMGRY